MKRRKKKNVKGIVLSKQHGKMVFWHVELHDSAVSLLLFIQIKHMHSCQ